MAIVGQPSKYRVSEKPTSVVLRVEADATSEIALGEKGGERLLGTGHLAARLEGEQEVFLNQVPMWTASSSAK